MIETREIASQLVEIHLHILPSPDPDHTVTHKSQTMVTSVLGEFDKGDMLSFKLEASPSLSKGEEYKNLFILTSPLWGD